MKRLSQLAALLLLAAASHGCVPEAGEPTLGDDNRASYQYILKSFDPERLGYGVESNGTGPIDQAMAYGGIAAAAALTQDLATTRAAADWLVAHSSSSSGIGWGLGWEWDAFGDDSVNPADTIYGITTAIAVEGLLNAYELTGEQQYLDHAVRALGSYLPFMTRTEAGGFFWYSAQVADARNVFNVSAMLAGMFARAGAMTGRDDFNEAARFALHDLLSHAIEANGHVTWTYADPATVAQRDLRWNDLVHAAYIAYGALLADRHLGTQLVDRGRLTNYLSGFFSPDGEPMEFRREEAAPSAATRRARFWGIGMMALAFYELGHENAAANALQAIADYEFAPYQFASQFNRPASLPRATSHVLLAVAVAEQSSQPPYVGARRVDQ